MDSQETAENCTNPLHTTGTMGEPRSSNDCTMEGSRNRAESSHNSTCVARSSSDDDTPEQRTIGSCNSIVLREVSEEQERKKGGKSGVGRKNGGNGHTIDENQLDEGGNDRGIELICSQEPGG